MSQTGRYGVLGIACILVVTAVIVSIPLTEARRAEFLMGNLMPEKAEFSFWGTPNPPGEPWLKSGIITSDDLRKQLSGSEKPLVFHVGVPTLFKNGHIPGSRHIGQASTPKGMEELKRQVQDLPRSKVVVLYCGCCPWKDCPNIRPAFKALQRMRFTHLRVLFLPNNFGEDWIRNGFPVEK
ncbi:MAG: rhodanese-like domain-containing protein [Acidobacteriia bacterium]|nr:rhodanese-like domain-containing protein [Terriglobia bacterium]